MVVWVQVLPDVMCGDGQAPVEERKTVEGDIGVTNLSEHTPDKAGGGCPDPSEGQQNQ